MKRLALIGLFVIIALLVVAALTGRNITVVNAPDSALAQPDTYPDAYSDSNANAEMEVVSGSANGFLASAK